MGCWPLQGMAAVDAADEVFLNARIYTLDETQPWAEALAVRGDEIIYVGDAVCPAGTDRPIRVCATCLPLTVKVSVAGAMRSLESY